MDITLTYSRKTKINHFKRFMIESDLLVWYVWLNNNGITSIRERLWDSVKDDIIYDKPINKLPSNVMDLLNNSL